MGRAILLRLYLKKQRTATWNPTTATKTPVARLFFFCSEAELFPASGIAFDSASAFFTPFVVPYFSSINPATQVTSVDPISTARYFVPKVPKKT